MAGRFSSVNKGRSKKPQSPADFRSKAELSVAQQFSDHGLPFSYEQDTLPYTLSRKYTPDFRVGDVFVEVKGWWAPEDRAKLLAVFKANPETMLFVALERPLLTISKTSKTTYAQWAEKNGIPWCPVPIPQKFLDAWLSLQRVTFNGPAIVQMRAPRTQLSLFDHEKVNTPTVP